MPRIQQLPTSVITKIAAGEVIERPASVIKELLENSIDAGSRRIEIDLDQGGTERIAVVDDGCGIEPDDLPLAFASHATSKLRDADDLFRIGTLGFRGEALASVGGVARVTLQSRPTGRAVGAEVQCNGGELSAVRPWNGAPGTRIDVRHLFFNTPVRKRFMRAIATELGHVVETVTRLSLAYPGLHLVLRHNGKLVHEVPATAGLVDRIGLFFGAEVRDALYRIERRQGPNALTGFIADPACERGSAKLQYLFVNGRWVRDRSLMHALQEAYRGLLMTGRYAVGFLFLEVPADQVDVNVHPTKSEVRFRDGQSLYHLVRATVRDRLTQENLTARLQVPPQPPVFASSVVAPWDGPAAVSPHPLTPSPTQAGGGGTTATTPAPYAPPVGFSSPPPSVGEGLGVGGTPPQPPPAALLQPGQPVKAIQLHDAYLVVEMPQGMLVIDQHALHERILYEQFQRRFRAGHLERQRLLIPEPIDLTAEQSGAVLEARDALAELGLEVDDFGGGTVLLGSYPTLLGRAAPGAILRGVVDFLVTKERPPTRDQLLNDLMSLMACKAAVKAGDRLTPEEVDSLIAQRELALDPHHCPHGRPTALLFSRQELDKQFRRT